MIQIVAYQKKYENQAKTLLVQLQSYLVAIDEWHLQQMKEVYQEEYFKWIQDRVMTHQGEIFLALEEEEVVGLVAGIIEEKDKEDMLTNCCPKRGIITELVIDQHRRGNGVGKQLMNAMESYLKKCHCEWIAIDVFGPNKKALHFYENRGYQVRNIEVMKKA